MRIIAGRWKGRRLAAPSTLPVRPTTDMAKEALFNILSNYFDLSETTVTDLFSGTGNIAYEFASRGAQKIRVVENNRACVKYIVETARRLGIPDRMEIIPTDVFRYIERPQPPNDIVFADPPYDLPVGEYLRLVALTMENKLLSDEGILVVEHPKTIDLSGLPWFSQMRRYGTVHFSFFEYQEKAQ